MRIIRALTASLASVLAFAAPVTARAATVSPSDVHPISACSLNGCNGVDPIAEGCDHDAVTQYTLRTSVGTLEHRYSPSCNASWARISNSSPGTGFYIQACYASYVQTYNVPSGFNNAYTNMIPGGGPAIRVGDATGHGPC